MTEDASSGQEQDCVMKFGGQTVPLGAFVIALL